MKINSSYDSRYNSEYKQRIQELTETILDMNYGATVPLEVCTKTLHYNIEIEEEKKKFLSTMNRVKNFLVGKGYILKPVKDEGYYILKPKQISGHCYRTYVKRSQRLLDKSSYILNFVDRTELNETRMEEYELFSKLNQDLILAMEETIVTSGYYSRKAYYNDLKD